MINPNKIFFYSLANRWRKLTYIFLFCDFDSCHRNSKTRYCFHSRHCLLRKIFILIMSEEAVEEVEEIVPAEEEEEAGSFFVSQIYPVEPEEQVKPEAKEPVEGEETADDIEDDAYSYQTEPTVTINPKKIAEIAQHVLEDRLKNKEYSPSTMKKAASQVSFIIREEIKRLNLDRYRIISHVTIGEKCDQDVMMNFLYLWKPEYDHYAIAKYEHPKFFATALVFLIYKQ